MISLQKILLVFLGGGIGSSLRYALAISLAERFGEVMKLGGNFPFATLGINVVGSFCIGVIVAFAGEQISVLSEEARILLAIGFCGGFTTFSTFSLETFSLLQTGRFQAAFLYMGASVILCLLATAAGLGVVYWLWKNLL